jgi:hypothetical protein
LVYLVMPIHSNLSTSTSQTHNFRRMTVSQKLLYPRTALPSVPLKTLITIFLFGLEFTILPIYYLFMIDIIYLLLNTMTSLKLRSFTTKKFLISQLSMTTALTNISYPNELHKRLMTTTASYYDILYYCTIHRRYQL